MITWLRTVNEMARDWTQEEATALIGMKQIGLWDAYKRASLGPPSPDILRDLGLGMWKISYGLGFKDDTEVGATVGRSIQHAVHLITAAVMGMDPDTAAQTLPPSDTIQATFATHWVDQACPEIVIGHRYAAALMSTKVNPKEMGEVRPPWRAFLLKVPNGLLHIWNDREDKPMQVDHICVYHRWNDNRQRFEWAYCTLTFNSHFSLWRYGVDIRQLMLEEIDDNPFKDNVFCEELTSIDQRASMMIGRLIVNTCIAITDKKSVKQVGKNRNSSRPTLGAHEPPTTRVFQVGRKINIRCQDEVRDYVLHGTKRGKHGPPTVQTLVCGHHKSQPYGPKTPEGKWGPQRKWIWREPFWRGDPDAPIVTRPHKLESTNREQ